MKHVKEITSYEFDIDSFEKNQAYKIILPTLSLQKWEVIGILDDLDSTNLVFITNQYAQRPEIRSIGGTSINTLTIDINDYIKGDISIVKLGVV
jgi:hypothetical protein